MSLSATLQPIVANGRGRGMSDIAIKASEPMTLKAQLNEDWLAVVDRPAGVRAALVSVSGTDLLGWAVTTSVYTDLDQRSRPSPRPMPGSAAAVRCSRPMPRCWSC